MMKKLLVATALSGMLMLGACSTIQNLFPNGSQTPAQQVATLQSDFSAAVAAISLVEANTTLPATTVAQIATAEKTVADGLAAAEADLKNGGNNITAAIAGVQAELTDLQKVMTNTGVQAKATSLKASGVY